MTHVFTEQLDRSDSKGKYAFVSLGCPKNLVDSERMLGRLQLEGYELVSDPRHADFAIVNTCGFIGPAKEESIDAIMAAQQLRRQQHRHGGSGRAADGRQESSTVDHPRSTTVKIVEKTGQQ